MLTYQRQLNWTGKRMQQWGWSELRSRTTRCSTEIRDCSSRKTAGWLKTEKNKKTIEMQKQWQFVKWTLFNTDKMWSQSSQGNNDAENNLRKDGQSGLFYEVLKFISYCECFSHSSHQPDDCKWRKN